MAPERHSPSDQYVATQTIAIIAIRLLASVTVALRSRSSSESPGATPNAASHRIARASGGHAQRAQVSPSGARYARVVVRDASTSAILLQCEQRRWRIRA